MHANQEVSGVPFRWWLPDPLVTPWAIFIRALDLAAIPLALAAGQLFASNVPRCQAHKHVFPAHKHAFPAHKHVFPAHKHVFPARIYIFPAH